MITSQNALSLQIHLFLDEIGQIISTPYVSHSQLKRLNKSYREFKELNIRKSASHPKLSQSLSFIAFPEINTGIAKSSFNGRYSYNSFDERNSVEFSRKIKKSLIDLREQLGSSDHIPKDTDDFS